MYKPNEIYTPIKNGIKKGLQYVVIGGLGAMMLGSAIANNTYGQSKDKVKIKFELFKESPYNPKTEAWKALGIKDGKLYEIKSWGISAKIVDDYIDKGDTFEVMIDKKEFERYKTVSFLLEDLVSINGLKIDK